MSPSSTSPTPSTLETPPQQPTASAIAPPAPSEHPPSKLQLDLQAVADVDGLAEEVTVLRASIRHLASGNDIDVAAHIKVLAELRHQIEALCRALKTRQSLEGANGVVSAADVARMLDELDDKPEVER